MKIPVYYGLPEWIMHRLGEPIKCHGACKKEIGKGERGLGFVSIIRDEKGIIYKPHCNDLDCLIKTLAGEAEEELTAMAEYEFSRRAKDMLREKLEGKTNKK